MLKQADYKNAFCNPSLPDDEITIIHPPLLGHLSAQPNESYWLLKKTLYGLKRSPRHWYDMASKALLAMGLSQSPHDPCLFYGIPSTASHPAFLSDSPITVGLYVNDMVYYSLDNSVEEHFKSILASQFLHGYSKLVLGTHFTWSTSHNGDVPVHLTQVAFAQNLVKCFCQQNISYNPRATPY